MMPPADAVPSVIRITIGLRNDLLKESSRSRNYAQENEGAASPTLFAKHAKRMGLPPGRISVCGAGRTVSNRVEFAVAKIQALHFLEIERARATASEYGHLIAAFVYTAIAINAFGDSQRRPMGVVSGNQPGSRARAETRKVGMAGGRK